MGMELKWRSVDSCCCSLGWMPQVYQRDSQKFKRLIRGVFACNTPKIQVKIKVVLQVHIESNILL